MNNWKSIFCSVKFWILIVIFFVTTGASCSITGNGGNIVSERIALDMWVVVDSSDDFNNIISAYSSENPNIQITITKFRLEDYEQELLNALAEDRGPDIFFMHNTNIRGNLSKIVPLPEEISVPKVFSGGTFKRDVVVEIETSKTVTPLTLEQSYVDTVMEDVIIDGKVYGLPLYVDTLALYYNRDLLNAAGFAQPPQFWSQFQNMTPQLTKINLQNQLIQSGAALGTAHNVQNAPDIVALLMMQTGAKMTNDRKTVATFNNLVSEGESRRNAGVEGLRFYSDFARTPPTTAYSWNEKQPDNLEAFVNGKLAFFFGYSYHLPLIRAQSAGKLNFSVAPMVQIQKAQPVNLANYWIPTVSKKSENVDAAWHFLQFMASSNNVDKYLSVVKRPSALRALVDKEKNDEDIFAFAGQSLTAKNWYYGYDVASAKKAFETMITQGLTLEPDKDVNSQFGKIVSDGERVVNQTYRK